jgi:hypothetical protein
MNTFPGIKFQVGNIGQLSVLFGVAQAGRWAEGPSGAAQELRPWKRYSNAKHLPTRANGS